MFNSYKKSLAAVGIIFFLFSTVLAYSGGSGTAEDPYQIGTVSDWNDLMNTSTDWDNKYFVMTADVNLLNVLVTPIGNHDNGFSGVFDGNNHKIINLTTCPFYIIGGRGTIIKNLGVEDVNIIGGPAGGLVAENYGGNIENCYSTGYLGQGSRGGLVGYNQGGNITNCYSTVTLVSGGRAGGLVGYNQGGTITSCYAAGSVTGYSSYSVGGLVGYNESGTITNCYNTGTVTGYSCYYVGGLVGENWIGSITNSYSSGAVNNEYVTGGLVGQNHYGNIENCYSTSTVSGTADIGGLAGWNNGGSIANCYHTGSVSGNVDIGGLVGFNGFSQPSTITNCYSAGAVDGTEYVGGLIGSLDSLEGLIGNFWDVNSSQTTYGVGGITPDPIGVTGKTTAEMKMLSTFTDAGWDFSYTDGDEADWFMPSDEYPILVWQISPADIYTDGKNNFRDFAVFADYWMRDDCAMYNYYCDFADLDFDGDVDIDDLVILMSYWLEEGIYN